MSDEKAIYDIVGAFQSIEEDLIKSMKKTMKRHIGEENKEQINWSQWQAEMMKGLEEYKRENMDRLKGYYSTINDDIDEAIRQAYATGESETEAEILKAIRNGYAIDKGPEAMQGRFFATNERKLNSLIDATRKDFEKAENSILRRTEDVYRQTIFKAQMHYNTGAKTLWQAVDMATHDFLAAGINSIEYRNGARVNIASYAEMALRTANKRANLAGNGNKRTEYGIYTVIITHHGNACPRCIPYQGRVFIDDVYQSPPGTEKGYPRLSEAVSGGLFHPNCRDGASTYYDGITEIPEPPTDADVAEANRRYNLLQRQRECERNIRKYSRLSLGSLDAENATRYASKADQWKVKYNELLRNNKDVLRREPERLKLYGITTQPPKRARITPPKPSKNVAQFVRATNTKDAAEFITNNFGIACGYGKMNIDIVNAWNNALTRSLNMFPELTKNFGFVGSCQERNKGIKEMVRNDYFKKAKAIGLTDAQADALAKKHTTSFLRRYVPVGKDSMAQSWAPSGEFSIYRGVCINAKCDVFKDAKAAAESLKWQVKTKFHPVGCDNVESVLDHEIGHQLDALLGISNEPSIQKMFDDRTRSQITEDLNEYAWKNSNRNKYSEFVAEAWSEYCNNPRPREIAQKVGETIIRKYNKKFGG